MSEWISVKDKNNFPVVNETILLTDGFDVFAGFLDSMHEYRLLDQTLCSEIDFDVLFFMTFPSPPQDS